MKKYIISSIGTGLLASVLFFSLAATTFADLSGALLPTTSGSYSQWVPSTGTNHYAMVNEASCNGNTNYVSTLTAGARDSFGVGISSIPNGAVITRIDIIPCVSKKTAGVVNSNLNVFYQFNGTFSADGGNYSLSDVTPTVQATTTFAGLSINKFPSSTFEIGAVLTSGTSGAKLSQIRAVLTYTPIPAAPTNLAAQYVSTTTPYNLLNWRDNSSNEMGFSIERGSDGFTFTQLAKTTLNSYRDLNPNSGANFYRVRAYNLSGSSFYSNTASSTAP